MPQRHRLAPALFSALANGGGDTAAMRELGAAERSRTVMLISVVARLATQLRHPEADVCMAAHQTLRKVEADAPGALDQILRHPSVGAWALRQARILARGKPQSARPGQLAEIAGAAAIRGRVSATVALTPHASTSVVLPSLGTAHVGGPAPVIESTASGATVIAGEDRAPVPLDPHTHDRSWNGLPRLVLEGTAGRLDILLDPMELHSFPASIQALPRVPAAELTEWRRILAAAWTLLTRHHRRLAREMAEAMTVVTPLPRPPAGQVSLTFRRAFGCVAMSRPQDGRTAAVTFAHEMQHAKLAALADLLPLLHPGGTDKTTFYAPWRDDPRPLDGLLQGVYAHIGVTDFWERQRHHETDPAHAFTATVEFARWRSGCEEVLHTLDGTDRLTATGRAFLAGMATKVDGWKRETVPPNAWRRACELRNAHHLRWRVSHT